MDRSSLVFREIDLQTDAELCVRFQADTFACSFGSAERFFREAGPQGQAYLDALRRNREKLPGGCVHVWVEGQIVGQVEMRLDPSDSQAGHVTLYYLVPEVRGHGLGAELDDYAMALFRDAGMSRAWLRVNPSNHRAVSFYLKQGWEFRGPDPNHPEVVIMDRALEQPEGAGDV